MPNSRKSGGRPATSAPSFEPVLIEIKAPRAGDAAGQRVHRAGAAAGPHRRRTLFDARLFGRQPAAGTGAVRAAFSDLPHLHPRPRSRQATDRQTIETTIAKARGDWFAADDGIFDFLRDALTLDLLAPGRAPHSRARVRRFASKTAAVHRPVDGEVAGGHRLLSLPAAAGAERGRRQSRCERRCRLRRFHAHMSRTRAANGRTASQRPPPTTPSAVRTRGCAFLRSPNSSGEWAGAHRQDGRPRTRGSSARRAVSAVRRSSTST